MTIDGMEREPQREPLPSPVPPAPQLPDELEVIASKVTEFEEQARRLIRERPVAAILGAVGVGYLVARLLSRESR